MSKQIDAILDERHNRNCDSLLRDASSCGCNLRMHVWSPGSSLLADVIQDITADFVVFLDEHSECRGRNLFAQVSDLEKHPDASAGVVVTEASDRSHGWRCGAVEVASLWERPRHVPLFRRTSLANGLAAVPGELAPSDPGWDVLIRLTAGKQRISVCPSSVCPVSMYPGSVCAVGTDPDAWKSAPSHQLVPRRPGLQQDWLLAHLHRLDLNRLELQGAQPGCGATPEGTALRAGLFQWHDYLDESHACAQEIEGVGKHRLGDHWHAIMHRREPDYGNSQYWFRRVGHSPIYPELSRRSAQVLGANPSVASRWEARLIRNATWEPCAFVDFCEAAARDVRLAEVAREIQECEMELLFAATLQAACGD